MPSLSPSNQLSKYATVAANTAASSLVTSGVAGRFDISDLLVWASAASVAGVRAPRPGRDRTPRPSPRPGTGRRGRSLEDLRRAVAALKANLMRAGGTAGPVVEVDEEVRV